jgi:ABC-2 type transport system ATP-binding protein
MRSLGPPPGRIPLEAIVVIGAVVVAFVGFCLVDIVRAKQVRYLPKAVWALITCLSMPWGGIVYLAMGRVWGAPAAPLDAQVKVVRLGADADAEAGVGVSGFAGTAGPAGPAGPAAGLAGTVGPAGPGAPAGTAAPAGAAGPGGLSLSGRVGPVALEVDGLTKRFGQVTAVDDLSFVVQPGRVTGFLGPNGAGKTTTMRVILGLDAPTAGTALVGGRHYARIARPLREVGSLLDANAVHGGRTAWFHLLAIARSNGLRKLRVSEVLELTGLDAVAGQRVKGFSLGMKQRLGIAVALLADPPVLVLDEPANGLDPEGMRWIRLLLRAMAAQGRTVLVSSHLMGEMAMIADHLIIIGRGRLLADLPTGEFIDSYARQDVLVRSPRASELAGLLVASGGSVSPQEDGGLAVTGLTAPAIGDLAAGQGIAVHELAPRHGSLEAAYLDLTGASTEFRAVSPAAGESKVAAR